jgi:hypothetical protein
MKIQQDNLHNKLILTLTEEEFLAVLAAVRGASSDDTRKGRDYEHFYSQEKGYMVSLYNSLSAAEQKP